MLTRKHFATLARHLRERQPANPGTKLGYHLAITAVASALQEMNPRFDRTRFVQACTTEPISPAMEQAVRQLELEAA